MRKSALKTAALLLSLYTGFVYALGVGGIETSTALNEPLKARIALSDTQGLRSDELVVRLASIDDFEATGIEYASYLADFIFEIEEVEGKRPVAILVTSFETIREPYVNFLVNISWPNGRLVKEYTILLDPVFGDSNLVSYNQNIAQQVKQAMQPEQELPRGDGRAPRHYADRLTSANDTPSSVTVLRNDTMWEIAARVAPAGASVHQTMHAIKATNPEAFIDNNINRVKAGYVLSVPTADEISAISRGAAVKATQRDYQLWTSRQSSSTSSAVATTYNVPEGELTLAAASDASASDAVALETISALKSENKDLDDRLMSLEQQLEDMNRLLQLKNAQLALLQNQGAQAIEEASQGADQQVADLESAIAAASDDAQTEMPTGETEAESTVTAATDDAAPAVAEVTVLRGNMPSPIEAPTPLWANSFVQLGLLLALLVALAVAFFINRRKERAPSVEIEDGGLVFADEESIDLDNEDVDRDEPVSNAQIQALEDQYEDDSYEDIVAEIESRLAAEPHRADLQLFLLQQAAHHDDSERYVEHFRAFEAIGKPEDISKAKNLLKAIKGNLFWLEEDQTVVQAPVFADLELEPGVDESDDFFKDFVQETELTDEMAALLEASEGAVSLDQLDADEAVSAVSDDEALDFSAPESSVEAGLDSVPASSGVDDGADELDFDLGGLDLDEGTESAQPALVDSDDDGLDFESTVEATVEPVASESEEDADELDMDEGDSLDDIDLDGLDFGIEDADSGSAEAASEMTSNDDALADISDLDFDAVEIPEEDAVAEEVLSADADSESEADLDDLFDDFDLSAVSNDDKDAQVISDAVPDEAVDMDADLSSMLDDLDLGADEASDAELLAQDDSSSLEGDIIDLSEFIDDSDNVAFDANAIEEPDEEEASVGSDDFDDLDDFNSLLDSLGGDLDVAEDMQTKLEMAEAFIEMGDAASAKEALNEVIESGDAQHRESARSLLAKLGV